MKLPTQIPPGQNDDSQKASPASEAERDVVRVSHRDKKEHLRIRRRRTLMDRATRALVVSAGFGVIGALALIFIYLFSETVPMFQAASIGEPVSYNLTADEDELLHLAMDRHRELAVRYDTSGTVVFFEPRNGRIRKVVELPLPEDAVVTAFSAGEPRTGLVAMGLSDGSALVVRHRYEETYPDDQRHVEPVLEYPLGDNALVMGGHGEPLVAVAVQEGGTGYAVAGASETELWLARYTSRVNFMTGESEVSGELHQVKEKPDGVWRLLIDITMRNLFAADADGLLYYYDISSPGQARLADSVQVVEAGSSLTSMEMLLGTVSVIVGTSGGEVTQWFLVRDEQNQHHITRVREFQSHDGPVGAITPEYSRKGFMTGDTLGNIGLHHATSARTVAQQSLGKGASAVALAPRNNGLLVYDGERTVQFAELSNPHPEVSFAALWNKVWYEGRSDADYIWQASSATDEFEPKLSLVPLSLGTLKAAFYAMLFAMPLAIMGAIFTAYFMPPRMRSIVKPSIEIMEALPTVVLGFLAGLWLAPFFENNLPSVFSVLVLMPIGMLGVSLLWSRLPRAHRQRIPGGWEPVILVPVVLLIGWASVTMSPYLEIWFFSGDMRQWLTDHGYTYDQRNALVVGVAMGFAVIPTIFSITEDAIFNVPKHLTQGSLALGATPWQSLRHVVLLTASAGIFSAIMIGFGRAVGETMIVLMATGNSPIMNFNIFEGMRTLSANIAVELPETAVGSTHYRILFLAALVLFAFTFVLNTLAEIVRQRLREKYGSL